MPNFQDSYLYNKKSSSIEQLIKKGSEFLYSNSIDNAKNEVEWYLQKLYSCDKINLYKIKQNIVCNAPYQKFCFFLNQRIQKVPFQYLIGKAPFYGREYIVTPDTLIPRPESELLIQLARNKHYEKLLDIGTGTGCLAITAEKEQIAQTIDAIDVSKEAIEIAKMNSNNFNTNINFIIMDILIEHPNIQYDIILSNPPYISQEEYQVLNPEIKAYEPADALTDFKDGYSFYNRYAIILDKILKKGGVAFFELSHFFKKSHIINIFKNFSNLTFYQDLNGDNRVVKIIND